MAALKAWIVDKIIWLVVPTHIMEDLVRRTSLTGTARRTVDTKLFWGYRIRWSIGARRK